MRTSKIISLSNKHHLYLITITLLIISFFAPLILILFIYVIYKGRRLINFKWLFLLVAIIALNYVTYININTKSYNYIVERNNDDSYIIVKDLKRYTIKTKEDLVAGDIVTIYERPEMYRKQTRPYSFNQYEYNLGKNIFGYFNNPEISSINNKDNNSNNIIKNTLIVREKIFRNINKFSWFFNRDYINENEFNYLFLLVCSTYSLTLIYKGLANLFFYMNISNDKQKLITLYIHLLLTFIFTHIILIIYLVKIIVEMVDKKYNLELTKLDIISLEILIILIINPVIIYNQTFVIYSLLIFSNAIIKNKYLHPLLLTPFQLMWFQSFNIVNILIFRFTKVFRVMGIILLITTIFISYKDINTILLQINNILNYIPINIFTLRLKNINLDYFLLYYFFLSVIFIFPNKKILIVIMILFNLIIYVVPNYKNNTIYFLDTGQGNSAVYIVDNIVIGIDCYNYVDEFLINHNLKLDYLILTHNDFDHIRESDLLIKKYKPTVIINEYSEFNINRIDQNKVIKINIHNFDLLNKYNISFYPTINFNNENDNSLVFKINLKGLNILFTGDISTRVENILINTYKNKLKSDILVIAHHGSKTSSSTSFINTVNPKVALISVGYKNQYNLPNIKVIETLNNKNIEIYRTDLDGTLILTKNNDNINVIKKYMPY